MSAHEIELQGQRALNSAILLRIPQPILSTAPRVFDQDIPDGLGHIDGTTLSDDIVVNEGTIHAASKIQSWYRQWMKVPKIKTATTHLVQLMHQLDRDLLLFWKLLHEGLRVCKYTTKGQKKKSKVILLDKDRERLIIRPLYRKSLRFITKSVSFSRRKAVTAKRDKGIYLQDIAEIRPGAVSLAFPNLSFSHPMPKYCFSIISSEQTWDLELPTTAARDQAVARFRVILDVLQDSTSMLASRGWVIPHHATSLPIAKIETLFGALVSGIQVTRYHTGMPPARNFLWIDPSTLRICVGETKERVFKSLSMIDVAEVRKGINSVAFYTLGVPPPASQCFSIIASENVIECQVPEEIYRNLICHAFRDVFHFYSRSPQHTIKTIHVQHKNTSTSYNIC
ncbi:hypothetical protein THRCLA_06884 [Thraustotheca clavata]|uniref:Uncharacterized protein n=1 Tax=Thraustotheca clavata TaxID=74557 RepID=A0A1V9ZI78_9STRA|nr:hypothetical protein THRCLA_06884 [Thraustotheca clavata]